MAKKESGKVCIWKSEEYSPGSEVCQNGWIKICDDGSWKDTGAQCDDAEFSPLIQSDGKEASLVRPLGNAVPLRKLKCCKLVYASPKVLKFRNVCDDCMILVILYVSGSKTWEKEYEIGAHKTKTIQWRAQTANPIDEYKCDS